MKLGPGTLKLFSARAQRVLRSASRTPRRQKSEIIAALQAVGRPVFGCVVEFERRFGGLRLRLGPKGMKQEFRLGIEPHAPCPDADELERATVPIGWASDGVDQLFMNAQGEVISRCDDVVMKSSSIVRYIEQLIIGQTPRWKPPRFTLVVRPALGAQLAGALGMTLLEEASDVYESWWDGEGLRLLQVLFSGSWQAGQTTLFARSIEDVVCALRLAHELAPTLRVNVSASPSKRSRPSKRARRQAPSVESWEDVPGARRYAFGDESSHMTGAVWVVERKGNFEIQQYRIFIDETGEDPPELLLWETLTASGEISRDMEG